MNKVYKVHNSYSSSPHVTGHWIMAKSEDEAIAFVKENGITGPMIGRKIKRCCIVGTHTYEEAKKFLDKIHSKGKIWNLEGKGKDDR